MDAPRHTDAPTLPPIEGITISFEPEVYGVTSWIARIGNTIITRSPWEKLTHKMTKEVMQCSPSQP